MTARAALVAACAAIAALGPRAAQAWNPLRRVNPHVAAGTRHLRAGDADAALREYDAAARDRPDEGGVHLDRGVAMYRQGKLDEAREAFLRAAEPTSSRPVRAIAHYNAGNTLYRQGHYGEAVRAYARALRQRPGWTDAQWNLELAARKASEQRQQQEPRRQQQQASQQADPQPSPREGDEPRQEPQPRDARQQERARREQDQAPRQAEPQPRPDEPPQAASAREAAEPPGPRTRQEAEAILDALQQGEENLQIRRLRRRVPHGNAPVQDW